MVDLELFRIAFKSRWFRGIHESYDVGPVLCCAVLCCASSFVPAEVSRER